jgi:antitoxin component YwqK of YwqJK toxin-antitoxin module
VKRLRMLVLLGFLAAAAIATYLAQPRTKLETVQGQLCEFYETFYDNGKPRERHHLIHAEPMPVRHGTDRSWYENGQQLSEVHLVYGDFEGRMRTWWPSGNLQWEAHFSKDMPHGSFQQWFESGQLRTRRYFHEGLCEGKAQVWLEDGSPCSEFTARKSKYHGVRRVWNSDGSLRTQQLYENGVYVGEWTVWDETGVAVLAKGNYIDGEPCEGTFAAYDPDTEDNIVIDVSLDGMVVAVLPGSYGDTLPHQFAPKAMWNFNPKEPAQ